MLEALKALLRSEKFLIAVVSMIVWAAGRWGVDLSVEEVTPSGPTPQVRGAAARSGPKGERSLLPPTPTAMDQSPSPTRVRVPAGLHRSHRAPRPHGRDLVHFLGECRGDGTAVVTSFFHAAASASGSSSAGAVGAGGGLSRASVRSPGGMSSRKTLAGPTVSQTVPLRTLSESPLRRRRAQPSGRAGTP